MNYKEKQKYYKNIINRENFPAYPEGKKITLKSDVLTERLIKHINILPYIASHKDMNDELLYQLFELQTAKDKIEKEVQEKKCTIEELAIAKNKYERKMKKAKKRAKEVNQLNNDLDNANVRIKKLKTNNKSHREKLLQFDDADRVNAECIQELKNKNKKLVRKLKKVTTPKIHKIKKPLAIEWKPIGKQPVKILKTLKTEESVNQTKFYNNLKNKFFLLVKKNPKLPKPEDCAYPVLIRWLKTYENKDNYDVIEFKFNNDLISIYKAVKTYKLGIKKFLDDKDELIDYTNKLINAINKKFNFHNNTIVDLQLVATLNGKKSIYNIALGKTKHFTIIDLQLIAEYDGDNIDMGRLYEIHLFLRRRMLVVIINKFIARRFEKTEKCLFNYKQRNK